MGSIAANNASALPWASGADFSAASPYAAPPRPPVHWSQFVLVAGCIAMLTSFLLVLAGVPGKALYDSDGKGKRNKNTSSDPMKITESIDLNMKYIAGNTGYEKGQYNQLLTSINNREDAMPELNRAIASMNSSVVAIDQGLANVESTTTTMRSDMEAMAATSESSAGTMEALSSDITGLSGKMAAMVTATQKLIDSVTSIEGKARGIADKRTSAARKTTTSLNSALPAEVPKAQTDQGEVAAGGGFGDQPAPPPSGAGQPAQPGVVGSTPPPGLPMPQAGII